MAHDSLYWDVQFPGAMVGLVLTAVPVLLFTWWATRQSPARRRWAFRAGALVSLMLFCPCTNWVVVEPVHKSALARMGDKARSVKMEGLKEAEVRALFGEPTFASGVRDGKMSWDYLPVPYYLQGASFQVHFKDGAVSGWENYDW